MVHGLIVHGVYALLSRGDICQRRGTMMLGWGQSNSIYTG